MKRFKKILSRHLFWYEGDKSQIAKEESQNVTNFKLSYRKLPIGILSYSNNEWHFAYSDEFKSQDKIPYIINFPNKEKEYKSKELWPFFSSRIPSRINTVDEKYSMVELLDKYGYKVITNPFVLAKLS
ncbi:MAG: HipA N-terminal domain-containing protein [Bacteroidales bacterium]|jgi:HipA-like protein|nr:HipA N-terminal domain-containing protein [Bacteroidales bacterium]